MKKYEVKVIVTNTHYITVEAENKEHAEQHGEVYGWCADSPISTSVEVESVTEEKDE